MPIRAGMMGRWAIRLERWVVVGSQESGEEEKAMLRGDALAVALHMFER